MSSYLLMFQSYNPHIFLRDPSMPVVTSNICSVVALGADDCSVSVWQTKSARPLIVAKEVFERQIMDLSWYVVRSSNEFCAKFAIGHWMASRYLPSRQMGRSHVSHLTHQS